MIQIIPEKGPGDEMKRKYIILLLSFAFAFLGALIGLSQRDKVETFDITLYQDRIILFSSDKTVGEIYNRENAVVEAEAIFIEEFGVAETDYKPYCVQYDPKSDVWLVFGSLHRESPDTIVFGSSPCVLIKSNGEVLASWFG